jgi:hypothetical protein
MLRHNPLTEYIEHQRLPAAYTPSVLNALFGALIFVKGFLICVERCGTSNVPFIFSVRLPAMVLCQVDGCRRIGNTNVAG